MTKILKHLSLLLCLTTMSLVAHAQVNDFDKVCHFFQKLEKSNKLNTMTNLQKNDFILSLISKELKPTSDARVSWEAIGSAEAAHRYELFKSSAESVLKSKWRCEAMKKLAPTTGEF